MDLLTYSSADDSPLNNARRKLWSDKYMLGCANVEPEKYDKAFWMGQINRSRAELRKVARELREKMPAKKVYRVAMRGEVSEFGFWERAHTRGQAMDNATARYADCFKVVSVEQAHV